MKYEALNEIPESKGSLSGSKKHLITIANGTRFTSSIAKSRCFVLVDESECWRWSIVVISKIYTTQFK
uniref:Uncharacterized protein n=1 Tax=Glossina brevipalpis TaxID=37001 RepID=A0A1A9W0Y7_9MUSC